MVGPGLQETFKHELEFKTGRHSCKMMLMVDVAFHHGMGIFGHFSHPIVETDILKQYMYDTLIVGEKDFIEIPFPTPLSSFSLFSSSV